MRRYERILDAAKEILSEYECVTRRYLVGELKRRKLGALAESGIDWMLEKGLIVEKPGVPDAPPRPYLWFEGCPPSPPPKTQQSLTATSKFWGDEEPPAGSQDDGDAGSEGLTPEDIANYGKNYERDKWIFENWSDYTRDEMRDWLFDNAKETGWEPIDKTAQLAAVKKYAAFIGKPVPKGKSGPRAKA